MSPARPAMSVILQLHMTEADVDEILAELQATCELAYFAGKKSRFTRYRIEDGPVASQPEMRMLLCATHPWERADVATSDFYEALLSIQLPRVRNGFLEEVALGAKVGHVEHADRIATWARFLRRYRRTLTSGAMIGRRGSDDRRYIRNAHATARALDLARAGTPLTGPNGGTIYEYGPSPVA
jgi:hypothetical protein